MLTHNINFRCSGAGILLFSGMLSGCVNERIDDIPQLGKASIAEVIAAMSLEEKISMLMGEGYFQVELAGAQFDENKRGPVVGQTNRKVPGAAGTTFAVPRLGIPSTVMADGPVGVRIWPTREDAPGQTFHASAFPSATLLASSWDEELMHQVGAAMGYEAKEYGVDVLLGPAQNIHRYPLGGRNFEYYSEDPLLSGKMSAAMVRGIQSQGVGTSIKHFVANNHEWNRNTIDVKVDMRALREIYLRGFEITVKEGKPRTVMTSYNKLNGTYTSEDPWLLTEVLRGQWKYDGLVVTDWFGGMDTLAQVRAGNELLMPGTRKEQETLTQALRAGTLDESILERNIARILEYVQRTPAFAGYTNSNRPDLAANARIARTAAADGMVLLKNEHATLPLQTPAKLALFGQHSYEMSIGGSGSSVVNEAYSISLTHGLHAAGFTTDAALADAYAGHLAEVKRQLPERRSRRQPLLAKFPEYRPAPALLESSAETNDIAIITLGGIANEGYDRSVADYALSETESQLLASVAKAFHAKGKPVVVLLNIGAEIETISWQGQVDAVLLIWQPGQEAGHAVADVLSGKTNPSGRLTDTFARRLDDYPAAEGFPGVVLLGPDELSVSVHGRRYDRAAEIEYGDSIWVGYRHFNTRNVDVAYPFGYGLSYTRFAHTDLKLDREHVDDALTASITITNIGDVAGREVVQVYVAAPSGGLETPAAELRAFAKTSLLQPGQSQTLHFALNARDLASFDPAANAWVAASGQYEIRIGASSRDIRQHALFNKPKATQLPL